MKLFLSYFNKPFLANIVFLLALGFIFLSKLSIKLFSDGDISNEVFLLNNYIGWMFIFCHFILLLIYILFNVLEIKKSNAIHNILIIFDSYLFTTFSILILILLTRYLFVGNGRMDTLFPLFATLDVKTYSIWIPLSFIIGIGIIVFICYNVKNVIEGRINDNIYLLIIFLSLIIITISQALTDNGIHGLTRQFSNAGYQYHEDTMVIRDIGFFNFIDNFIEIQPSLSMHTTGHPLFSSLFYYFGYNIFGYNILYFSLFTIFFGCLTVFPLFFLIKKIIDRRAAIFGIGVFIFIPNVVIFTATSYDSVLMFFSCLTLTLYYYAINEHSKKLIIFCGISLFVYMLLTFHSLVMGLFIVGWPLYYYIINKKLNSIISGFYVGVTTLTLLGVMHLFGYNYVESFFSSLRLVTSGNQILTIGPYLKYLTGNLLAFFIYLGVPTITIMLNKKNYKEIKENKDLSILLIFTIAIILIMDIILLGHLEQERVWLFMVPFIIVFISKIIILDMKKTNFTPYYFCFLFSLFIQTWLFQLTMDTKW